MRRNAVKRTIADGGVAVGTLVLEFGTTGLGRIAAGAGADFVLYDMEHSGWSIETVRTLMAATRGADIVPIVRPPASHYHLLSGPLDMGAMGLMVPMVETEDQARAIVRSTKYPPVGARGAAFGVAHDDYTGGDVAAKMRSTNDELLLIAQIETAAGLENVERIAAVDGIDVVWIGQFDLTASLGIPGQFGHPDYLRALERVVAAARSHGKTAGFMVTSVDEGRQLLGLGFRILAYWGDIWIYTRALEEGVAGLRAAAGAEDPGAKPIQADAPE
jgi:2-dehydro-3-deoxyglucarate aldolase/4-hydroxy-2-oxoheptanedioate aldolase